MYDIIKNSQLAGLESRFSLFKNDVSDVQYLGRNHTTSLFSIRPDGRFSISYKNESLNDVFSVDIQMVKITSTIDLLKKHTARTYGDDGTRAFVDAPAFTVAIGAAAPKKKKDKKRGKRTKNEIEIDEDDEDAYINEYMIKAMKVHLYNTDVRALIGKISDVKEHSMLLWDVLLSEGYLKTLGNDFTSFCNTFVILPVYCYSYYLRENSIENCLSQLSSYDLVKKLLRYFLYNEDPSIQEWVEPVREYFEPKSIVEILEHYKESYSESALNSLKELFERELNNTRQTELENYPPQIFNNIREVNTTYPLHALRAIYLKSWSSGDFSLVEELAYTAHTISKSEKCKFIIQKRGKFESYETYAVLYEKHQRFKMNYEKRKGTKFDFVNIRAQVHDVKA